jgi:hypothetical protein
LLAHTTLAITPERVPLGLLQQQVGARDPDVRHHQDHQPRPIAEQASQTWLTRREAVIAARAAGPDTHFGSGGDREGDGYDLFLVQRPLGVDLLVRAAWDRTVDHAEKYLWAAMATAAVSATVSIHLGRCIGQPARDATLEVRWRQITRCPPTRRAQDRLPTVTVWAVWAIELNPPAGVEPVEWLLLTTVPISTTTDALERLAGSAARWGIEIWPNVLQSGCRVEDRHRETATRLNRGVARSSVIAGRILDASMLARVVPDTPWSALLDDDAWQARDCRIQRVAPPPATPPTLRTAVRWIAQWGGFQGRTGEGEPGVSGLWQGLQHLMDRTAMDRLMRPQPLRNGRCI